VGTESAAWQPSVEHLRSVLGMTAAIRRGAKRKSASAGTRRRSAREVPPAKFKFGKAAVKRVEAKRGPREQQEPAKEKFKFGKQTA